MMQPWENENPNSGFNLGLQKIFSMDFTSASG